MMFVTDNPEKLLSYQVQQNKTGMLLNQGDNNWELSDYSNVSYYL